MCFTLATLACGPNNLPFSVCQFHTHHKVSSENELPDTATGQFPVTVLKTKQVVILIIIAVPYFF